MVTLTLSVENAAGKPLASSSGEGETWLVWDAAYAPGDRLRVEAARPGQFLILSLDDGIAPSFVFCKDASCTYSIPFGEATHRAFTGTRHYLHVRLAAPEEITARKNLAHNTWATHEPGGPFPFASANVETRGEMVFAAKNAIDGLKANHFHGEWPYTSWGINRDPEAAWRIDFGRTVILDEAVFYLRADFPHDAWWQAGTLHFSDGSSLTVQLEKTAAGQRFPFPARQAEWVVLDSLIKASDPSPFPALTQLELWGTDLPQEGARKCI